MEAVGTADTASLEQRDHFRKLTSVIATVLPGGRGLGRQGATEAGSFSPNQVLDLFPLAQNYTANNNAAATRHPRVSVSRLFICINDEAFKINHSSIITLKVYCLPRYFTIHQYSSKLTPAKYEEMEKYAVLKY